MKLHRLTFNNLSLLLAVAVSAAPVNAIADAATELAKKTQNPVSDLISVPFENNANFNAGPDDLGYRATDPVTDTHQQPPG